MTQYPLLYKMAVRAWNKISSDLSDRDIYVRSDYDESLATEIDNEQIETIYEFLKEAVKGYDELANK